MGGSGGDASGAFVPPVAGGAAGLAEGGGARLAWGDS